MRQAMAEAGALLLCVYAPAWRLHSVLPPPHGPQLQNQYAHDVEYEIERTDGSSETGTLPPCIRMRLVLGSLRFARKRTVFVTS